VADGLGGHAAGAEASRLAINTLVNLALETSDWVLRFDSEFDIERVMRRASARFEMASAAMTAEAAAHPELEGFATTLTLALSVGSDLFLAHAGD
jgi:protein phosphatase